MYKVTEVISNSVNIHFKAQEDLLFKFGRGYVTGLQMETLFLAQSKFYAKLDLWKSSSFDMSEVISRGSTIRITDN
jgi:hypothetical protein